MGFGRNNKRSAPAPAPPPMARPPMQAAPPPMQAAAPQGPSMMGMMGSSMAGSMAGSVIGHGISNQMFGSGSSSQPQQVAAGAPPAMPAAPVCQFETQQFLQCMTQTADNMDYCRNMFDQFKLCQTSAAQQQQPQM